MENTASYIVKVSTPGHVVFYKGRKVRTPVVFKNVFEHELTLLEAHLNRLSLKYTIDNIKEDEETTPDVTVKKTSKNDDVIIEELYPLDDKKEPESIMDKLISENT